MSKLFFHAYETETQLWFSPPPLIIPVCRCHVETPLVHLMLLLACGITLYNVTKNNPSALTLPISYRPTDVERKEHWTSLSPKEHNSATRLAFESKFLRLCSVQLSEHTPGGRHAQLHPCSARLCTSFVPSLDCILIIETILKTKSPISSLAHTCVSLKASLLPQHLTPKQFTSVMDTREVLVFSVTAAGFSPNSWCLWL